MCIFQLSVAQEKWGKVSKEILQMKTFSPDTAANAVFLFDVGDMEVGVSSEGLFMEMKRHVRIKILTEEGKKFANVKIPYWHKDKVDDIKAHTILPTGKKSKLKGNQIFEENVSNRWKQKVFAIPGVEVGSVIEYKYKFRTEYLTNLEPWYFQNSAYTLYSKLSIILYPQYSYTVFYQNVYGEDAHPVEEEMYLLSAGKKKVKRFTWFLENLKPIRKEPYMRALNDYRMAIFFQLLEYKSPYTYYKFIKTWDDLAEKISKSYADYLKQDDELKKVAQQLVGDTLDEETQIKVLYNYVRDEIETDWTYSRYPREKPKKVYKNKKGRLTEKNFLLINLLRQVGLQAKPMLISTRSHGRIKSKWPQLDQFNLVVAYVKAGYKTYILDTSQKYCPFGTLPSYDIVEQGFLVTGKTGKIINIPQPKQINMISYNTSAELNDVGDLKAECTIRYEGYRAITKREILEKKDDKQEYFNKWIANEFPAAELDSFKVEGFESVEQPLTLFLYFHVPEFAQIVSDNIYFPPPLISKISKNPFHSVKRNFPVEYNYLRGWNENIRLKLPEGYQIEEMPQFKMKKMNNVIYVADCKCDGSEVIYRKQFLIKRMTFPPSEYAQLRGIFSEIINSEESQIVLTIAENKN